METKRAAGIREYGKQWFAALVTLFFTVCYGACEGFSSILLSELRKPNSTIPISNEESSWIASVFLLSGPAGSLSVGVLMETYGRVKIVQLAYFFMFLGWVVIALAETATILCVGRLVTGLAVGMEPAVLVYVTEVVLSPSHRSAILTLLSPILYVGVATAYLVGYLLAWRQEAAFVGLLAALGFVAAFAVPESPTWLVCENRAEDARRALRWLTSDGAVVERRLCELRLADDGRPRSSDGRRRPAAAAAAASLMRTVVATGAWKPFLLVLAYVFFQQFSGYKVLVFYAVSFYDSFEAPVDGRLSAVVFAALVVCSSLVLAAVVDRFRRRTLLAVSAAGVGILCAAAAAHLYLCEGRPACRPLRWLPVACVWATVVFATALNTVTWIVATEMFAANVRAPLISALWTASFVVTFASVKSYPAAAHLLRVRGVLAVFAGVAFAALLCTVCLLPETRGRSSQEIQRSWLPRPNNTTTV